MKVALTVSLAALVCLAATAGAAPVNPIAQQPSVVARPVILPQPVPLLTARADVVVTGKVTKIEDKTVSAVPYPGAPNKLDYQIAVVKVEDAILNAKGIKEIRVGFIAPPANAGVPIRGGIRPVTLVEDEEALLFLTKNADGDFYMIPGIPDAIKKVATDYKDKVEEAKKAAKLLADPMVSLKAKDAEDRFLTAAMLIERYRTQKPPYVNPPKQEPIDATESKLILEALRDADWTPPAQPKPGIQLTPINTFHRLVLNKDDGWTQPAQGVNYADAAKEWLKDNADKYRIKRFVAEKKDDDKKDK